jgi:RNA recognition motif-containing protein
MKIFVANLPYHIGGDAISQLFKLFGRVSSSRIITENGKSKGFGFLEMDNDQAAEQAIRELDGSAIGDRKMIVRPADDQQGAKPGNMHKRPRIKY